MLYAVVVIGEENYIFMCLPALRIGKPYVLQRFQLTSSEHVVFYMFYLIYFSLVFLAFHCLYINFISFQWISLLFTCVHHFSLIIIAPSWFSFVCQCCSLSFVDLQ